MFQELAGNIAIGLSTALTLNNLFFCVIGVTVGMLVGVLPGIGAITAISLLFPITFYLDPLAAVIMLGGIYYGGSYGGSTASILLNLPGTPSSAITCLDGYPMAKQGRAGVALFMTTIGSFVGASIGILMMMLFSPLIVSVALEFGPAEYFALMLLGLCAASVISDGSAIKGLAMVALGILLGTVGTDIYTGDMRYTFGVLQLADGVSLVALAMGMFGIAEIISAVRSTEVGEVNRSVSLKSMVPTKDDLSRSWAPMLRGSGIGSLFGVLPGVGATVAAFISYAVEKRISKDPSRFGKGAIEGIVGPESTNNAADQTAFIPTMTLGIPGSATMALILGALMVHGISPGPTMVTQRPEILWGLVMSFWIGNLMLLVLNIPMISVWIRILSVPYHHLFPAVVMFVCVGVYAVNNSAFEVMTVIIFGAIGYGARLLNFSVVPLLLGFVLGPMMEEHFRRAMIVSHGSFDIFVTRPISAGILAGTALLLLAGTWAVYRARRAALSDGDAMAEEQV